MSCHIAQCLPQLSSLTPVHVKQTVMGDRPTYIADSAHRVTFRAKMSLGENEEQMVSQKRQEVGLRMLIQVWPLGTGYQQSKRAH